MGLGTYQVVVSVGGVSVNQTIEKTFDHPNNYGPITLPAGSTVTDWTKTDADTAGCNLPSGHGLSSGKMAVFWEVAGVKGMRYDVDGVVTGDALTLDSGSGDDFPASATEDIVVSAVVQINTAIDGDEVALFGAHSTQRASLYFEDSGAAEVAHIELQANEPFTWHSTSGLNNALAGNPIIVCYAANGGTTDAVLNILSGEDSTP